MIVILLAWNIRHQFLDIHHITYFTAFHLIALWELNTLAVTVSPVWSFQIVNRTLYCIIKQQHSYLQKSRKPKNSRLCCLQMSRYASAIGFRQGSRVLITGSFGVLEQMLLYEYKRCQWFCTPLYIQPIVNAMFMDNVHTLH